MPFLLGETLRLVSMQVYACMRACFYSFLFTGRRTVQRKCESVRELNNQHVLCVGVGCDRCGGGLTLSPLVLLCCRPTTTRPETPPASNSHRFLCWVICSFMFESRMKNTRNIQKRKKTSLIFTFLLYFTLFLASDTIVGMNNNMNRFSAMTFVSMNHLCPC